MKFYNPSDKVVSFTYGRQEYFYPPKSSFYHTTFEKTLREELGKKATDHLLNHVNNHGLMRYGGEDTEVKAEGSKENRSDGRRGLFNEMAWKELVVLGKMKKVYKVGMKKSDLVTALVKSYEKEKGEKG